jgi:hypothetical protein
MLCSERDIQCCCAGLGEDPHGEAPGAEGEGGAGDDFGAVAPKKEVQSPRRKYARPASQVSCAAGRAACVVDVRTL